MHRHLGVDTLKASQQDVLDGGAHWQTLANMTEPSVCGGDAALRQITLTTCCRCWRLAQVGWGACESSSDLGTKGKRFVLRLSRLHFSLPLRGW